MTSVCLLNHRSQRLRPSAAAPESRGSRAPSVSGSVAEWLHRTEDAAIAYLEVAIATSAAFRGVQRGVPTGALLAAIGQQTSARHREICRRFGDQPLVGAEVQALRKQTFQD